MDQPITPAEKPKPARVLVVDDEAMVLRAFKRVLKAQDYEVFTLENGREAMEIALRESVDVVLLDIRMPLINGLEVLEQLKGSVPDVEVIMMTGYAAVDTALKAVRAGAYDYLTKPFDNIGDVVHVIAKAAERKRLVERNRYLETELQRVGPRRLLGTSAAMHEVYHLIKAVAPSDANVLVVGESGTGKELVARQIHRMSNRGTGPWMAVNCSALSETLLETELFGHVKGAFTGAVSDKQGLLTAANRGTLFLDEIGDLPQSTQVKLLRVLQDREIRPVGSTRTARVDVRVICATNVDLQEAMAQNRFREDLFYRINVITIRVPPLRERVEDVPLLAHHFLRVFSEKAGKPEKHFSPEAVQMLCQMPWPGNVRELENAVERAVVLSQSETIRVEDLPRSTAPRASISAAPESSLLLEHPFAEAKRLAVSSFEKHYVEHALRRSTGNVSEAARNSGLDRSNFKRIASRHALRAEDFRK